MTCGDGATESASIIRVNYDPRTGALTYRGDDVACVPLCPSRTAARETCTHKRGFSTQAPIAPPRCDATVYKHYKTSTRSSPYTRSDVTAPSLLVGPSTTSTQPKLGSLRLSSQQCTRGLYYAPEVWVPQQFSSLLVRANNLKTRVLP